MRESIGKLTKSIFSIFIMLAIAGGGVVFIMFILGIIIGGSTGTSLAVNVKNVVMPQFIRFAAIAVFAGLIDYYLTGKHALTVEEKKD